MASNLYEWTTEYTNYIYTNLGFPCTGRGGIYNDSNLYAARRGYNQATDSFEDVRFQIYTIHVIIKNVEKFRE